MKTKLARVVLALTFLHDDVTVGILLPCIPILFHLSGLRCRSVSTAVWDLRRPRRCIPLARVALSNWLRIRLAVLSLASSAILLTLSLTFAQHENQNVRLVIYNLHNLDHLLNNISPSLLVSGRITDRGVEKRRPAREHYPSAPLTRCPPSLSWNK